MAGFEEFGTLIPTRSWILLNINYSTFGFPKPALSAGGSRHTQFRLSAPKARYGRPGNSLSLKQSGPFILRRA